MQPRSPTRPARISRDEGRRARLVDVVAAAGVRAVRIRRAHHARERRRYAPSPSSATMAASSAGQGRSAAGGTTADHAGFADRRLRDCHAGLPGRVRGGRWRQDDLAVEAVCLGRRSPRKSGAGVERMGQSRHRREGSAPCSTAVEGRRTGSPGSPRAPGDVIRVIRFEEGPCQPQGAVGALGELASPISSTRPL